jgi:hypothetical protein
MSLALMNVFAAFPKVEALRMAHIPLNEELSIEVLSEYIEKNERLKVLQIKNCIMKHDEYL